MWLRLTIMLVGYFGIPVTGVIAGFAVARRARNRGRNAGA